VSPVNNLTHGRDLAVLPDAGVLGADAALGRDGDDFGEDEAGTARGVAAEVLLVPKGHVAIVGRVLAHGGDHDAVGQRHVAQLQRGKERIAGLGLLGGARRGALLGCKVGDMFGALVDEDGALLALSHVGLRVGGCVGRCGLLRRERDGKTEEHAAPFIRHWMKRCSSRKPRASCNTTVAAEPSLMTESSQAGVSAVVQHAIRPATALQRGRDGP
jgi:hypothetical protein